MVNKNISEWNRIDNKQLQECHNIIPTRLVDLTNFIKQDQHTLQQYCTELKRQKLEMISDEEQ